jgi:hypothetical protein
VAQLHVSIAAIVSRKAVGRSLVSDVVIRRFLLLKAEMSIHHSGSGAI